MSRTSRAAVWLVALAMPACSNGGDSAPATSATTTTTVATPTTTTTPSTTTTTTTAPATTTTVPAGSTVIDAAGGAVTSDDGRAVLTVPPGALSDPAAIRVLAGPVDLGVPGDAAAGYTLEPAGLAFAAPAELSVSFTGADFVEPMVAITSGVDGGPPQGIGADVVVDGDSVTATVHVSHFSEIGVYVLANEVRESFEGRRLLSELDLEPKNVGLSVGEQFFPTSFACCYQKDDSEDVGAFEDLITILTNVPLPVDTMTIDDVSQLKPAGVLSEGKPLVTTAAGSAANGVRMRGDYTCAMPGEDRFGSVASFRATYVSPVESLDESVTLTAVGHAVCAQRAPLVDVQQVLSAVYSGSAGKVVVEHPDGTTTTEDPNEHDLAVDRPQGVTLVGTQSRTAAVFIASGASPSNIVQGTCFGTAVGAVGDLHSIVSEATFGVCPEPTAEEPLVTPVACASTNGTSTVVAVPVQDRQDGQVVTVANVRTGPDRVLQFATPIAKVADLAAMPILDVPMADVCSAVLATPALLQFPAPPQAAEVLNCVQARYDDSGRLVGFPASVLLFVRGPQPFTGATGVFDGVPTTVPVKGYTASGGWWMETGLYGPAQVTVVKVTVKKADGSTIDVTDEVVERLGGATLNATVSGVISPESSC